MGFDLSIPRVGKRGGAHVSWRVLSPIIIVALAAAALLVFVITEATRNSDATASDRQRRLVAHVLDGQIDQLVHDQSSVSPWDDAVIKLRDPLDRQWLDANIGLWMYDYYAHDRVVLFDPRNKPIYLAADGKVVGTGAYARMRGAVHGFVRRLRAKLTRDGATRSIDASVALANGAAESLPNVADLAFVEGRPAIVSVVPILPEDPALAGPPGETYLLASVRFLDRSFITDLSERYLLDGTRYAYDDDSGDGESSAPLHARSGAVIGHIIWRPELPGSQVLRDVLPATVVAVAAVLALLLVLGRNLRRAVMELQASEAQASHLAFHDVLTGLPNRALFDNRLDHALVRTRRGERAALLTLDLDRFKQVNDTLGHQAGDALIREFASRLSGLVRDGDTVARLGGDEFAILLAGISGSGDVDRLCERILTAARAPFDLIGNQVFVGVSIGVVLAPEAGGDRGDLMRKADIALYRAKGEGRACYRIFTETMDETIKLRSSIEEDLRAALATGEALNLFYQPQVAGVGQSVVGLEALLRWEHPTRGAIPPDQFIGVAEETGLIGELGDWVLRQACAASLRWPHVSMAINLSPVQFRSAGFAERVVEIVGEIGADPRNIELEVTESVLLDNDDLVRAALKTLRAAGFRIALDDFGTGYSSLSYLRCFEVDKIKIDRSFVRHLGQSTESTAIVTAVVTLGHAMGLAVTAEGVETDEQRRFLEAAGCDRLQGFLFSQALPEDEVASLLMPKRIVRGAA